MINKNWGFFWEFCRDIFRYLWVVERESAGIKERVFRERDRGLQLQWAPLMRIGQIFEKIDV